MPQVLLDAALRGALVALLLLWGGVLLRSRVQSAVARLGVLMAAGLCVQVVSSASWFESWVPPIWQAPWVAVSVGNAVVFWVFVSALFDDDFVLQPQHLAVWLAACGLSVLNCLVWHKGGSVVAVVALALQRALPLVFAVLTVWAAARNWRGDLVEARRRVRVYVVVSGIAYSLALFSVRLASPDGHLRGWAATLDMGALLLIVGVLVARTLVPGRSELFALGRGDMSDVGSVFAPAVIKEPAHAADESHACGLPSRSNLPAGREMTAAAGGIATKLATEETDPVAQRLELDLVKLMDRGQVFRTEGLTLAGLAAQLSVPEYRLRHLINQRLGYRNFNAFINAYRLEAARVALSDPAQRDLPVLTLALDAGFQSIGPFNRAFKAATGITPTEFRKNALG